MTSIDAPVGSDILQDIRNTMDRLQAVEAQLRRVASGDIDGVVLVGDTAGGGLSGTYPDPTVVSAAGDFTVGDQLLLSDSGIVFGTTTTVNLYKGGDHILATDDVLHFTTSGLGALIRTHQTAGSVMYQNRLLAGDANSNFRILGSGEIQWGNGGASAVDTVLYRDSANLLKTNDSFEVTGTLRLGTQSPSVAFLGDVDTAKWMARLGGFSLTFSSDHTNTTSLGTGDTSYAGRTYRPKVEFQNDGDVHVAGNVISGGELLIKADLLLASGKGCVRHDANASAARDNNWYSIEWIGSIQPTNAIAGDTWVDTTP